MADLNFAVVGRWPFPADMLRRDGARAASPDDARAIRLLSGEHAPDCGFGLRRDVTVNLVMETEPSRFPCGDRNPLPLAARWESFGWRVQGVAELDLFRASREAGARRAALRASAIAKLTPEELDALGVEQ